MNRSLNVPHARGNIFGVMLNQHVHDVAVVDDPVGEGVEPSSGLVVARLRICLLHLAQGREECFRCSVLQPLALPATALFELSSSGVCVVAVVVVLLEPDQEPCVTVSSYPFAESSFLSTLWASSYALVRISLLLQSSECR
jgi:hypothetical protein